MKRHSSFRHTRPVVLMLTVLALLMTIASVYAAYQTTRPITEGTYGYINQYNLYGEGSIHKGVDFPAALDTDVIAVADGVVRDVNEEGVDDCRVGQPSCSYFGNYILVRHTRQHYDRTTGQMAYVYSLYAHLSWHGAFVNPGDNIVAGQVIGDVDNTGNSDGNHLHLQIMIDPDPNRTVDLSWTEFDSRNPELWVRPYYGSTGTVVGKVTNTSGNPIGGVTVYGLEKQIWGTYDYGSSLTYNNSALKSDDILVENWGTTDVTPGHYHITTSAGGNLGWHDVVAGQITYAGLYPVWLPYIRGNANGWNSTIVVRNNSTTYQAQVNTTFFNTDGSVRSQQTNAIPVNTVTLLTPPNSFAGSAIIVSSEDVSVVVENESTSSTNSHAYEGKLAVDPLNPGWGQIGTTLYAPVIMNNYYGWDSRFVILNAGPTTTNGTIAYYRSSDGANVYNESFSIPINGLLSTNYYGGAANMLYSARVTSSQPLASHVRQQNAAGVYLTYDSLSNGSTTVHAPLIMNNYYGWDTSVNVQNASASTASITVNYYNPNGSVAKTRTDSLPAYATHSYYSPNEGLANGFIGTARITSNQPVAVVVNQSAPHGSSAVKGMSYSGTASGTTVAVIPDLMNYWGSESWVSSVNVQNLGPASTVATLTYAGQSYNSPVIPSNGFHSFYVPNYAGTTSRRGWATVSASQPIAVVVNHSSSNQPNVDLAFSYIASNR